MYGCSVAEFFKDKLCACVCVYLNAYSFYVDMLFFLRGQLLYEKSRGLAVIQGVLESGNLIEVICSYDTFDKIQFRCGFILRVSDYTVFFFWLQIVLTSC